MTFRTPLFPLLLLFLAIPQARAVILYNGDNSTNTSEPASGSAAGLPFDSVGQLAGGTAVYLGNGLMLTANHVSLGSTVTFADGSSYAIDTTSATQLIAGVDLKVFSLTTEPTNITGVQIYTGDLSSISYQNYYVVGTGLGRSSNSDPNDTSVAWGDSSTRDHRWGSIRLNGQRQISYSGYNNQNVIYASANTTTSTTALTKYDSGAPLFTQIDGTWYLTAIAAAIGTPENQSDLSVFASGSTAASVAYFIPTSEFAGVLSNMSVPEPSTWTLVGGMVGLGALCLRRLQRRKISAKAA